jgi:predicted RecB family nuclease
MLATETQIIRLSQGQLNLLERCPRQFQHSYLEQLYSPIKPENEENLTLGSQFHLLMQQREMGLPIENVLVDNPQLQTWMQSFTDVAPEILTSAGGREVFRESEHYRTLKVGNYVLAVIYDLLIADNFQAQILDWKTYPKPPNQKFLEKNWQTRLYLYVLAETSEYQPENISMTYWFIQSDAKPESLKFTYNNLLHEQTDKKLKQLLDKLTKSLSKYHQGEQEKAFPQVSVGSKTCEYCQFMAKCERLTSQKLHVSEPEDHHLKDTSHEPVIPPSIREDTGITNTDTQLLNITNIQEVTM